MMPPLNYIANFILIFLSFSCLMTLTQTAKNTSVLDVEGQQLQTNTNYYIMPFHQSRGSGGGLALSARSVPPCPHNVMQENDENSIGLSLRIFPADKSQQATINLSSDVNIVFWAATVCVQPTGWRVSDLDPITRRRYVRSGGVVGRPGAETVENWFRIEQNGDEGYKIVHCPNVCSECRVACGDVGVFVENGRRWLGLRGQPLALVFKKVN